ncbi:SGNH/GDSL hydrolase family protein [Mycoplasma phocoeninasale]|uniref:SGNH/GDSL hydrolase family protein n=1 Tax=Mycoplasma phocoeninasale TaxID=2726117 RepID=UPI0019671F05|nr:SGNH/GDSL hydrolase family protein [Mycoplasma phocoeninasale]MBN0970797.1 SGNH/GDSL hydrolase family protein [Mycoplasma phocoeninasale]
MHKTTEDLKKYFEVQKHEKIIVDDDINYVAIGDYFASGFNSKIGFNTNGMLENGMISGLDYPSFFANELRNNNFKLNSFYNLSIPSTNIDFIMALVKNDKKELHRMENRIDLLQSTDWHAKNLYKNYFTKLFNEWNINKNDFEIYHNYIKNANLITITLGFEDLFFKLPFEKIFKLSKLEKTNKIKKINDICSEIQTLGTNIIEKYQKLIVEIKNINPKIRIVITNYIKPLLYLDRFFDSFIWKGESIKFNLYDYAFEWLNYIAKIVSYNTKSNFVDIYDELYWQRYKNNLYENVFSLFCTERGYKKVAYDLFAKLALRKDEFIANDLKNQDFINKYIENQSYWTKDIKSYSQILQTPLPNQQMFKQTFGANKNFKILTYSTIENNLSNHLTSYLNISDYLDLYLRFSNSDFGLIFKNTMLNSFNEINEKYQSIELIKSFLNENLLGKKIILPLFKQNKIDKILFILQIELKDDNDFFDIDYLYLKNKIIKIIRSNQNDIYSIFKLFFSSGIINEKKTEIKNIAISFVKDIMNTNFLEHFVNFQNDQKFKIIREYLSSLKSFEQLIDFVVENIINYSSGYSKLNNFDELWNIFIVKNKFKLLAFLHRIFNEISSDENIEKTTDFLVETIKVTRRLKNFKPSSERAIKSTILETLNLLRTNPVFLKNCFQILLKNVKNLSLYNLFLNGKATGLNLKFHNFITLNNNFIISIKVIKALNKIKKLIKKN